MASQRSEIHHGYARLLQAERGKVGPIPSLEYPLRLVSVCAPSVCEQPVYASGCALSLEQEIPGPFSPLRDLMHKPSQPTEMDVSDWRAACTPYSCSHQIGPDRIIHLFLHPSQVQACTTAGMAPQGKICSSNDTAHHEAVGFVHNLRRSRRDDLPLDSRWALAQFVCDLLVEVIMNNKGINQRANFRRVFTRDRHGTYPRLLSHSPFTEDHRSCTNIGVSDAERRMVNEHMTS